MSQDAGGCQSSRGMRRVHAVVVLVSFGIVCVRVYPKADVQAGAGVGVRVHCVSMDIGARGGTPHVGRV